jgi:hypothetical protein
MRSEASLATYPLITGIALLVAPQDRSPARNTPRHDTPSMAGSGQLGDVWFIGMIVLTLSTRCEGARGAHRPRRQGGSSERTPSP